MRIVTPPEMVTIFRKWNLPISFQGIALQPSFNTTTIVNSEQLFVFPTPAQNAGLNILNLRRVLGVDPAKPPSFFDHPWYLDEAFARHDCVPGWHSINMDVLAGSVEQPLNYYYSLLNAQIELPTAVEVVLMLFIYFELTGTQLLQKKHTWCSDQASLGRFVTVGAFGRNGLFISSHPPTFASRGLGICGKFQSTTL